MFERILNARLTACGIMGPATIYYLNGLRKLQVTVLQVIKKPGNSCDI